jgi:hypothetical protein
MPSNPVTGTAGNWLKRLFVEDWSLKLLALAVTLVLWFFISGHQAEREVAIEPRIEGKPAPAFEVKDVVVTPLKIKVQGPANRVNALEKVTLPISVEGRRESFDAPVSPVPITDPTLELSGTVKVHVTIVAVDNSKNKTSDTN